MYQLLPMTAWSIHGNLSGSLAVDWRVVPQARLYSTLKRVTLPQIALQSSQIRH